MRERFRRSRPVPWQQYAQGASGSALPFYKIEWWLAWTSWALGRWALLEVLEHLGTLSVLVAVIFYFSERGNRIKQRHYQAWQVINTAQGRGGNGGRIEALQELNADGVSLTGVNAAEAFLQGVQLAKAQLGRCDLHASDLRDGNLSHAMLNDCNLRGANFRRANMAGAELRDAAMQDVDLSEADMTGGDFAGVDLGEADLRFSNAEDIQWPGIASMKLANIFGMKNVSPEFLKFASAHGAVSIESDEQWNVLLRQAAASQSQP